MKMNQLFMVTTITAPFLAIAVSVLMYPSFNIYQDALSDLGHATRSPSAPIFNLGLTVASFLLVIQTIAYLWERDRTLSMALLSAAFFLQLVAVYDEVYGVRFDHLHFIVSALFFIAIITFLLLYAVKRKRVWAAVAAVTAVIVWIIHFTAGIPPGAAIPELVSVLLFFPAYVEFMLRD